MYKRQAICIAARFYGESAETIVNAMGIAGSMAAALMQFSVDGSWAKKMHPGWGAHSGMYAFRLAREGYIGAREVFEGSMGLYNAHIRTTEFLDETFSDFYNRWYTKEVLFKFYPVCHMMHSHLDILFEFMDQEKFNYDDIESIHACLSPRAANIVALPPELKKAPETDYLMRFSIQFCLAIASINKRLSMKEICLDWLKDERVQKQMDKITVESAKEYEVTGYFPGKLIIKLKDGRVFEKFQKYETGTKENPAKKSNVLRKYYDNTQDYISKKQADDLVALIDNIENIDNAAQLAKLLAKQ